MSRRKVRIQHARIVKVFAERLRTLREVRRMTQRELALLAHVTVTYVSKLESGGVAPGIDLVERIATALDVPVPELLPPLSVPETADVKRKQLQDQFRDILNRSGLETLSALSLLFARLTESPALGR